MMTKVLFCIRHATPLCILPSGNLLIYKYGVLLVVDKCSECKYKYRFSYRLKDILFIRFSFLNRLFRLGVRCAICVNEELVILVDNNKIFEYNSVKNNITKGFCLPNKIRPLNFTQIKGINGFTDGVVFGGYLSNPTKKPVHIYRRVGVDKWEIVYTFSEGEINHIHNIVVDKYRDCLWVFTGDFDNSAAIWKVTNDFNTVEKIKFGSQKYRACVAFPMKQGLLYATDTPFADNYIYLLDVETLQLKVIREISGSCIYGCRWQDRYVFSSTVEPDGRSQTLKGLMFNRKRGEGIKDNYVHLYCGNFEEGFSDIYKEKKDCYPYIFQFGVFKFPSGINNSDTLYFQPIATKKNDLKLVCIKNK